MNINKIVNAEIKFISAHNFLSEMLEHNSGKLLVEDFKKLQYTLNKYIKNGSDFEFNCNCVNFTVMDLSKKNYTNSYIDSSNFYYEDNLKHCYDIDVSKNDYNLNQLNTIANAKSQKFKKYIKKLKNIIKIIINKAKNLSNKPNIIVSQCDIFLSSTMLSVNFMVVNYIDKTNKNRILLIIQETNNEVDIQGPPGPVGAQGPIGAQGPVGAQGHILAYAQGPSPVIDSVMLQMSTRESAGAVNRVLPHPTNPDIMYIGAVNGGVWKTLNAQAKSPKWFPLTDKLKSTSIGALAFDTADSTRNTIIAGIGRTSSLRKRGGPLTGLQISTNAGYSFTEVDGNGRLKGLNINGVVKHGNTILVTVNTADNLMAENVGLFQSLDNGLTFSQKSVGDGTVTGMPASRASSIIQNPENPTTIYASIYNTSNSIFNNNSVIEKEKNGIYKSTNMGSTWSRISDAALDQAIDINTNNIKLTAGPLGTIFVAIVSEIGVSKSGKLSAVFRSGNGGQTWQAMDLPTTIEKKKDGSGDIIVGIHPGGQGYTHFSFIVDPSNPNIVYIGGDRQPSKFGASNKKGMPARYINPDDINDEDQINIFVDDDDDVNFPNSIGSYSWTGRLFRGDASKETNHQWVHLTHSNTLGEEGGGTANNTAPHADSRCMAFDALGNLIESDDGGVYRLTNPRTNQGDWYSINGDLQVAEIHSIVYDPVTELMTTGTQDNGTQQQVRKKSMVWEEICSGDGAVVAVDTLAISGSSILYFSAQYLGDLTRVTYSIIDGDIKILKEEEVKLIDSDNTFKPLFYSPICVNSVVGGWLLVAGKNSIFESFNKGDTLINVGNGNYDNESSYEWSCIAYGGMRDKKDNPGVIYACKNNKVFIRMTSSDPLTETVSIFPGDKINSIGLDPMDWMRAFLVTKSSVYMTNDAGTTWIDITGNLRNVGDIFSIEIIRHENYGLGGIVVGTEYGLYVSSGNALGTWDNIGGNIPNVQIDDLFYSPERDVLAVGTLGRGAWVLTNIYSKLYGS